MHSSAEALTESGVRAIPPGAREAINAINAKQARHEVCPKMLAAHLPLVHQVVAPIARKVPANVLRDDLLAAGVSGLVDSLRKNGGDGGNTFEWYARTRIRGAVLDELRAQDWLTRRARDAVDAAFLRDEADADGVVFVGLDELSAAEEQDFLVNAAPDPESLCAAMETRRSVARALDKLSERERKVIDMYYYDDKKFREISAELDVCEPRVSQLHARALDKLKCSLLQKKWPRTVRRTPAAEPIDQDSCEDDGTDSLEANDLPPYDIA